MKEMEIYPQVITGIFTGILTSALIFTVSWIFRTIILPKIQDMRYKGFRIGGTWKHEQKMNGKDMDIYVLSLDQSADKLTGTFQTTKIRNDKSYTTHHDFNGYIMDGVVVGEGAPKGNSTIGHLSIFCQVFDRHEGPSIVFRKTGIDFDKNQISEYQFEMKKES